MRAHFYRPIFTTAGSLVTGASVRILDPNTLSLVNVPLYNDPLLDSILANPFVAVNGIVDFYMDLPNRVVVGITPLGGNEVLYRGVDVLSPDMGSGTGGNVYYDPSGGRWQIEIDATGHVVTVPSVAEPEVTLYGGTGNFGGVAGVTTTPSGASFGCQPINGWSSGAGQSFKGAAVGADGTVFVSTFPFTAASTQPTATDMEIAVLNPATDGYATIVVPTSTNSATAVDPGNNLVGGADIHSIVDVRVASEERIAFLSGTPYHNWQIGTTGQYPTLGYLRKNVNTWQYSQSASVTTSTMAQSTPAGATAFPSATNSFSETYYKTNRLRTLAVLPQSGHIAVAQYGVVGSSGGLIIMDPTGNVIAAYEYPAVNGAVIINIKEVLADPSSNAFDERIVILCDSTNADTSTNTHTMQEFRYNSSTPSLVPVTDMLNATGTLAFGTGCFDALGNLFLSTQSGSSPNLVAVFPNNGGRSYQTLVPPGGWPTSAWGQTVTPPFSIASSNVGGLATTMLIDAVGSSLVILGASGILQVISYPPAATSFTAISPVDLGMGALSVTYPHVLVGNAVLDSTRRLIWVPIPNRPTTTYPSAPVAAPQFLMRLDLARITGGVASIDSGGNYDPAGAASAAVQAHLSAADPHGDRRAAAGYAAAFAIAFGGLS